MMAVSVVSSFVIGGVSALFAWYKQDIVDVLFIAFTINSAGLFLPTVCGLFWKRSNSNAAFASILTSLVIVVLWYVLGAVTNAALFQIDSLWPAFFLSAAVYLILCFAHRQTPEERARAEAFYAAK